MKGNNPVLGYERSWLGKRLRSYFGEQASEMTYSREVFAIIQVIIQVISIIIARLETKLNRWVCWFISSVEPPVRVELTTCRLQGGCSGQLS